MSGLNTQTLITALVEKLPGKIPINHLRYHLYLLDWHHTINYGKQATHIQWYNQHGGPHPKPGTTTIEQLILTNEGLHIKNKLSDTKPEQAVLKPRLIGVYKDATPEQQTSLDKVIQQAKKNTYLDMVRLVYSTYPMIAGNTYQDMDLIKYAQQYKEVKPLLSKEN